MSDEKPEAEQLKAEATEQAPAREPAEAVDHAGHDHGPGGPGQRHAHANRGHAGDASAGHGHGHEHDHGLAHVMPIPLLFGVLAALLALTVATVAVTSIDLGAQGNLIVAMIIATVKAALVCVFFMHLLWDKKFNAVLFLTSVLFLILFLSMTSTDRGEYQHLVDEYRAEKLQVK